MTNQTKHSYKRVKERMNVKGVAALNLIKEAYYKGKEIDDYSGDEAKYLETRIDDNANGVNTIRVYREGVFLFAGKNCVTVLLLPEWFGKTMYVGKTKVRNKSKYYNFFGVEKEAQTVYNY